MKELLAPVGNFESLKQAIHNGCDAVYLGGKKFGARKFANNFTDEEIIEAIEYCHLYGVKIYITVNTVIFDNELTEVLDYILFLHNNGVDAVIMQDIGLIKKVRELYPNLEIHVSTQAHIHNQKQIKLLESLGVTRIVVAREMTLVEINKLATNLEIEAFIHGALCVCYSGQCLFSSHLLNRSGNRGECAGICRLPYELLEENNKVAIEGKYLLSPKELNSLNQVTKLMKSNITSFKIEGRMKSPTTIGYITKLYRKLINQYHNKEELYLTKEEQDNLLLLFNREFTEGHLFSKSGKDLMNIKSPNHIGLEIGEVILVTPKRIKIKLSKELNQEDGIRFLSENSGMIVNYLYNQNDLLISHGEIGQVVEVDNKINLTTTGKVTKTTDIKLLKSLEQYEEKKIPVEVTVIARLENSFILKLSDTINEIVIERNIISKAEKTATTKERIEHQIRKLGNTPFTISKLTTTIEDDLFIPISDINEIRREAVEQLINIRKTKKKPVLINKIKDSELNIPNQEKTNINVLVRNEDQLKACLETNVDNIYVTDEKLYNKYHNYQNIYLRLDRVKNTYKKYTNERLLIGEIGSLEEYKEKNSIITDYYLNVTNQEYIKYLLSQKVKTITISVESNIDNIKSLSSVFSNLSFLEVIIYGRIEMMIMKYCPLNMLVNNDQKPCNVCMNDKQYYLKDRNNEKYPIINNNELTHILSYKPIENNNLDELYDLGIRNFRLELFEESYDETLNQIKKYQNILIKN